jgi:FkbM family methyltransferase
MCGQHQGQESKMRALIKSFLRRLGYDIVRAREPIPTFPHQVVRHGINTVFDVGANIGQYGGTLRRGGYRGKIVSFEPVSNAFEKLRAQTSHDGLWSTANCALGMKRGRETINTGPNTLLSSFRHIDPDFATRNTWASLPQRETVDVITLCDAVATHPLDGPALLKLDIQGFEEAVLRASPETVKRFTCVQMEMAISPCYDGQPNIQSNLALLDELGFTLIDVANGSIDYRGYLFEVDGFFARI